MNFCSKCGSRVSRRVPDGDNLARYVCNDCGEIHYENPKNVVGTIPEWEDKVLLCRRAIEPRYGYWTLPAGFMENGETTHDAAARETREEAHANVTMGPLYTLINLPYIDQVHFFFRARLTDLTFHAGTESLEVRLFAEHEVPWADLAFATVRETLKRYFDDRRQAAFRFHRLTLTAEAIEEAADDMAAFDRQG